MRRQVIGRKARLRVDLLRHHDLAAELLGEILHPRRHVDRIADHHEARGLAIAELAGDDGAGVDADAEADRLAQILGQRLVQPRDALGDGRARERRLPAAFRPIAVQPEQGHQPVTHDLNGHAARRRHGAAHGGVEPIDHEHGVERQPALGKRRRAAHVDEHDDDVALLAEAPSAARIGGGDRRVRRQQRHDGDVPRRTKLAGETHARSALHPFEHRALGSARRRQLVMPAEDADTAGRASPAAAAHMRVRNVVAQARLEHRQPARHADRTLRIGERHEALARLHQAAPTAGEEDQGKERREDDQRVVAVAREGGVLLARADVLRHEVLRLEGRIVDQGLDRHAATVEAEQGQRRDQHRDGEHEVAHARIERLEPQPEVDAEAAVDPHDQQQHGLEHAEAGRPDPELQQLLGVSLVGAEQGLRAARAEHVVDEQERDGEAEHELGCLRAREAEAAPREQRPEAERHVGEQGGIEHDRARQRAPDTHDLEAELHRLDRDVAERVIEKVGGHEGEQHEPGREPRLAHVRHPPTTRPRRLRPLRRGCHRRGSGHGRAGHIGSACHIHLQGRGHIQPCSITRAAVADGQVCT